MPRVFLVIRNTAQVEGSILLDNHKTNDVVWDRVLGGEKPTRE